MNQEAMKPDCPDGFAVVEGNDEEVLLLETGSLVNRIDLWIEGYLSFESLSERQKISARRILEWRDSGNE